EPDEDDGPVAQRVEARGEVADPVDPDHHAQALPDGAPGAGQRVDAEEGERGVGGEHHRRTPGQVVDPGREEPPPHPRADARARRHLGGTAHGASDFAAHPGRIRGKAPVGRARVPAPGPEMAPLGFEPRSCRL
ncbi:MAG: hypothetical protein ACK56I_19725, partial [bacterium]